MSEIPPDLSYSESHEWVRQEEDGSVTIGITDHAQAQLGDLVFVELPESGTALTVGQELGVVESVKAASDVYSPVAGEVVEANEALAEAPETVNSDPYGDGWLVRVRPDEDEGLTDLLDADAYSELVSKDED